MLTKRKTWFLLAISALFLVAAVACGTDSGNATTVPDDEPAASLPLADRDSGETAGGGTEPTGNGGAPSAGNRDEPANGGLDPDCVELVLGRTVTGFGDVTDAERTRIFEECSEGGPGGRGIVAGFDPVCIEDAIGVSGAEFADLTQEQRQAVFEQCGGDAQPGGRPFGDGQGPPTDGAGGDRFAELLQNECVQNALGRPVTDISEVSQQEIFTALSQCGDSLGLPQGGFGGGQGGFGGGGQGGRGDFGGGRAAPTN